LIKAVHHRFRASQNAVKPDSDIVYERHNLSEMCFSVVIGGGGFSLCKAHGNF
jgi:hypothetical protein